MDKLSDEIKKEKKIIERCKMSIDRNEPYDIISMKRQINISLSKISTMKMKLFQMKHLNDDTKTSLTPDIEQQIVNTQLLCDGANKVHRSLKGYDHKNPKVLKEVEQTILELNEKLELLLECAKSDSSNMMPLNQKKLMNFSVKTNNFLQVSGLLKIRVTGLCSLPQNTKPRIGKFAAENFRNALFHNKKSLFGRYGGNRRIRELSNNLIVVMHVGGKHVATVVWNEKKTMYGGDEETIELRKCRQLDLEIYHADSRSLCAIGTMLLENLIDEHKMSENDSFSTFSHQSIQLIPNGTIFCQTSYTDPEHFMVKKLDENDENKWKKSIAFRRSGSVLARGTSGRYNPRSRITNLTYLKPPIIRSKSFVRSNNDSISNYHLMNILGIGAFGTVKLGKRCFDDKLCAIKVIEKDKRTNNFDTPELHILKDLNHPFICQLFSSFIEQNVMYIVLEFCEAGDLHTHLSKTTNGFSQNQVVYFAASIVLAVEYIHEKLYVHRDLKTENMMLTRKGHLKIIDFGLCKKLKNRKEKMNDIVGTTTHLAAEIHRRELYGIEMDWWAVGVSLYQLRTRSQPFYGSREKEFEPNSRIIKWPIFHDFLIGLLAKHPEARLGYYQTEDVKKHPIFFDIDFDKIYNFQVEPPYIPYLKPGLDLQFFDNRYNNELNQSESSSFSSNNSINQSEYFI